MEKETLVEIFEWFATFFLFALLIVELFFRTNVALAAVIYSLCALGGLTGMVTVHVRNSHWRKFELFIYGLWLLSGVLLLVSVLLIPR